MIKLELNLQRQLIKNITNHMNNLVITNYILKCVGLNNSKNPFGIIKYKCFQY